MLVRAVLIQRVGVLDGAPAVLFGVTVIVPVAVFVPPVQPPVIVTVYVNVPDSVGVPLIVTVFELHESVTPAGKPVTVAPVAVVVVYVMFVIAVLMHRVCALVPAAELKDIVLFGVTVIVPVAVFVPPVQPPVIVTVYVNVPETVGVPLIVTVFELHEPVTPAGKPVTFAPVAVVVVYVMFVIAVLMHRVCALVPAAELKDIVLFGVTVIVPVAFTVPQPPVNGIE
jgi:hypothetical protein